MSPLAEGCYCPNPVCHHFVVVNALPSESRAFDDSDSSWTLKCPSCGTTFLAAELTFEQVSSEWLDEQFGPEGSPGFPKPKVP